MQRSFASDNNAGVHPLILEALSRANAGDCVGYGDDGVTQEASRKFGQLFGDGTHVFPVFNGTAANVLACATAMTSYEAVITSDASHIVNDECSAVEKFVGCKVISVAAPKGKLEPHLIRPHLRNFGGVHHAQPKVISIAQSTEYGTVYTVDEVKAIADLAKAHGMLLHMDGARISNACATLGVPLRAFTRDAGVDLLSLGFTKNGAMQAEALVYWNDSWAQRTPFLRKQMGQLFSKMRFASAQFIAMLNDDLFLKNAKHANDMALYLSSQLATCREVTITQPVQANAIFAIIKPSVTERLLKRYFFYIWNESTHEVRIMTHFNHTKQECDDFVMALKMILSEPEPK